MSVLALAYVSTDSILSGFSFLGDSALRIRSQLGHNLASLQRFRKIPPPLWAFTIRGVKNAVPWRAIRCHGTPNFPMNSRMELENLKWIGRNKVHRGNTLSGLCGIRSV